MRTLTAAALGVIQLAAAVQITYAEDVRVYAHPSRPANSTGVSTVRALLIGYDRNENGSMVSPYIVIRFPYDNDLVRVYLADDTKIDGKRFFCPLNPGMTTGYGVCPRLPSALALRLPVSVDLTIWLDSLTFSKAVIFGTDAISVVAPPGG